MITCPLCGREVENYNEHHLVPASKGGKVKTSICLACHNSIHQIFTLNELRDTYNTIESLRKNERFQKYVKWIRNKPKEFHPCFKEKK